MKFVLYAGTVFRQYNRCPPNTAYCHPKYTAQIIKYDGSRITVRVLFSYYGVGPIRWIVSIINQKVYVKILEEVMLLYSSEEMPLKWVLQQDNGPKHTSRVAKKWFRVNGVEVMEWPAQSPDLNSIENRWTDVKSNFCFLYQMSDGTHW